MLKFPPVSSWWRLAAMIPFLCAAVSCTTPGPAPVTAPGVFAGQPAAAENPATAKSWWDDGGAAGPGHIVVDLDLQVATFYRGGNAIGIAAISSGVDGRNTPAGNYKILEKIKDKHSNAYGHVEDATGKIINIDATPRSPVPPGGKYVPSPMPFWMRLTTTGIGLHQGFLPGYAASHGCIRMDKKVIQQFYNAATVGMPVKVIRTM